LSIKHGGKANSLVVEEEEGRIERRNLKAADTKNRATRYSPGVMGKKKKKKKKGWGKVFVGDDGGWGKGGPNEKQDGEGMLGDK